MPWLLVAGCWLLVAGCWLLVAGCWLFGAEILYPVDSEWDIVHNVHKELNVLENHLGKS